MKKNQKWYDKKQTKYIIGNIGLVFIITSVLHGAFEDNASLPDTIGIAIIGAVLALVSCINTDYRRRKNND